MVYANDRFFESPKCVVYYNIIIITQNIHIQICKLCALLFSVKKTWFQNIRNLQFTKISQYFAKSLSILTHPKEKNYIFTKKLS